jgi:phosphorylcholine metabolism protein LicD
MRYVLYGVIISAIFLMCLYASKPFHNVWGAKDKRDVTKMLHTIDVILKDMNIDWFVAFGTLLGAYRHDDIIPWDDDLDIFVNRNLEGKISEFKARMDKAGYVVLDKTGYYKIFLKNGTPVKYNHNVKWPFIDLFFYDIKNDDVILHDAPRDKFTTYSKDSVFPLKTHKFGNLRVPVPKDARKILIDEYGKDYMTTFVSSCFNHKKGRPIPIVHYTSKK